MKNLSIKGVLIGIFFVIFLDIIIGIGLTAISIDTSLADQSSEELEMAIAALEKSTAYLIQCLILGLLTTLSGGYFAARIAKRGYSLNAGLTGAIGVVIGLFLAAGLPLWFNVVSFLLTIPVSLLGGRLARANHSSQPTAYGGG